jgi:hypothetical protein
VQQRTVTYYDVSPKTEIAERGRHFAVNLPGSHVKERVSFYPPGVLDFREEYITA